MLIRRLMVVLALAGSMGASVRVAMAQALSLEEAVARVLESNGQLRAERAGLLAVQQQAQLDALAPPLTLSAELENVAGTGALSGIHGAETTLSVGRVFELGGKRAARIQRGAANIELRQLLGTQKQLDLRALTTQRYLQLSKCQLELQLAQDQLDVAAQTTALVRERIDRGVAPPTDQALVDIARARAEIAFEHAEHELLSARFALAALWGAQDITQAQVQASADLFQLPAVAKFEVLVQRLDAAPETRGLELRARQLEAEMGVARASARPDLNLSLGVRRLESLDDQAMLLGLSFPLGTRQRADLALSRSAAQLEEVLSGREAAVLEARQQLFEHYQELRHARTEFEAIRDRMIPAAQGALQQTQSGYEQARYSLLQLTQAQASVLQLSNEQLLAALRYHQAWVQIARATASADGVAGEGS